MIDHDQFIIRNGFNQTQVLRLSETKAMPRINTAPARYTYKELATPANTNQMINNSVDEMKTNLYSMRLHLDGFFPIVTILDKNCE